MTSSPSATSGAPRLALIGCGAIAESFYLPGLAKRPEISSRLVLVDSNIERARALASRFSAAGAETDYRALLGNVEGVIIAVPHHLHYRFALDFLNAGANVLCEKPLTESPEEARELIRISVGRNLTLATNNTRRLFYSSSMVKSLLADGSLGQVHSITFHEGAEFNWPTTSGFYFNRAISTKGILLDIGAHVVDLICWWLGGKPALIESFTDAVGGIEATVALRLEHGGTSCEVRLSRLTKLSNMFRVEAERGSLMGDVYDPLRLRRVDPSGSEQILQIKSKGNTFAGLAQRLVDNFLQSIAGLEQPLIPAAEVIDSLILIEEAYHRARPFPMPWYSAQEVRLHAF